MGFDREGMDSYMRSIQKYPVLSREDEDVLTKRYAETQDQALREQLINANLRFVVKVAHEFSGYGGFNMLDIVQEGNVGLVVAVEKFDTTKGVRFITCAVWWIRAYIQNYIMRYWSSVKVGTTMKQRTLFYKLKAEQAQMAKLHPEASSYERAQLVAERMGVVVQDVIDMEVRLSAKREQSIDTPLTDELGGSSGVTLGDGFVDSKPLADEAFIARETTARMSRGINLALSRLGEQERDVVVKRTMNGATLQSVGEEWGVSREWVRQLEVSAHRKIRRTFRLTKVVA